MAGLPSGNPPQAEQTKDMIDTHRTGIGEHAMHHIAVDLVAGLFRAIGFSGGWLQS